MKQISLFDLNKPETKEQPQEWPQEQITIRYWDIDGSIHCDDLMAPAPKFWETVREWQAKNPDKQIIDIR